LFKRVENVKFFSVKFDKFFVKIYEAAAKNPLSAYNCLGLAGAGLMNRRMNG
jgi:hypothetical protein